MRHPTPPAPLALACLFALAPLLSGASAQEPSSSKSGWMFAGPLDEEDKGRADRGTKHLLHLRSGQVFRGRARETQDGWEIWQRGEWILLPPHTVVRASTEKDVLKRARELERESKRGDVVRRIAYADWLLGEGLFEEGLRVLDRVLREDPDSEEARAVLERHAPPIALPDPERLDDFLRTAARTTPAVREIAAQRLVRAPEIPGLEEKLLEELHTTATPRRAFAALALRRVFPGRHVRPLFTRALLDVSEDVRTESALALGQVGDAAMCVPFLKALDHEHAQIRRHAIDALGNMNYAAAVAPLMGHLTALQSGGSYRGMARSHIYVGRQFAYVQDYDVEVAQGAAIADPIINVLTEGVVLDAAAIGVHESVPAERAAVRRSLSKLTGADPGNTTAAWKQWWQEHGDEWMAETPPGPPSTPPSREY